jgi:hypothetical protein
LRFAFGALIHTRGAVLISDSKDGDTRMAIESVPPARMDTDEAARFLGLRRQTLVNWRCAGKGPAFIRMGKLVRYDRAVLEAFLAAQTVRPESQAVPT